MGTIKNIQKMSNVIESLSDGGRKVRRKKRIK